MGDTSVFSLVLLATKTTYPGMDSQLLFYYLPPGYYNNNFLDFASSGST